MRPNQRYDIAISFAGEDRQYADALADALKRRNVAVFYDKYEKAELWGKNLYTHLSGIYQDQARYCVMFLSRHYAAKVWTNHEREAAQAGAFQEHEEYILPVRLDDTVIPGILPTVGYLLWNEETPETIAEAILSKLKKPPPSRGFPSPGLKPATGEQGELNSRWDNSLLKRITGLIPEALSSKPDRKIVTPLELKGLWNRYLLMSIDWQLHRLNLIDPLEELDDGLGDGRLARAGLLTYVKQLEGERANERRRGSSIEETDKKLSNARAILGDLDEAGADAVDYLAEELQAFPDYLRRRATELLMKDDSYADGEISQLILDNARSRYYALAERTASQKKFKGTVLTEVDELAKKLGFN